MSNRFSFGLGKTQSTSICLIFIPYFHLDLEKLALMNLLLNLPPTKIHTPLTSVGSNNFITTVLLVFMLAQTSVEKKD